MVRSMLARVVPSSGCLGVSQRGRVAGPPTPGSDLGPKAARALGQEDGAGDAHLEAGAGAGRARAWMGPRADHPAAPTCGPGRADRESREEVASNDRLRGRVGTRP